MNEEGQAAVAAYLAVAEKHGLDPVQMAHAWVISRPFMTSSIIGATSMEQLKRNFGALEVTLSPDLLEDIEKVHKRYTYPCP
jgi:aryl-alcohol dehydrogenase-like predicted oxidoreductase